MWRHELRDITARDGDFWVDIPAGLPVTGETHPYEGFRHPRTQHSANIPLNLASLAARHATAEAAKAARKLLRRVDPRRSDDHA